MFTIDRLGGRHRVEISMKHVLILLTVTFSSVGAYALGQKILADHTHPGLNTSRTGIFDVSHGGGLDNNGGHYDRSTGSYHYHR